jgi:hypothetical protein
MTVVRSSVRRSAIAAIFLITGLIPLAARAAAPAAPTTYRECYKSVQSCERTRCKSLDGRDQVTCMQQCYREYETCASAASGGSAAGAAEPASGKERHHRRGAAASQPQ